MENVNLVITAISTVGFPIVCCGAMFWLYNKTSKENNEKMDKSTEAINNNTIALTKLVTKIGGE